MARRVFLSYQHRDHDRARGFDLMWRSPHVDAKPSVRHLLDPVKSTDPGYVSKKIREQIANTSVTIVLIGNETHRSDWVAKEVEWSLAKDHPNGILAVRLDGDAKMPDSLVDYAPEVLDWRKPSTIDTFEQAIERAALRAGRGARIAASATALSVGPGCAR
jgi:hypothetical protein